MKSRDIHIRAILQEMPQASVMKICLKITYLKSDSNFPGVNELNIGTRRVDPVIANSTSNRTHRIQISGHEPQLIVA